MDCAVLPERQRFVATLIIYHRIGKTKETSVTTTPSDERLRVGLNTGDADLVSKLQSVSIGIGL